MNPPMNAEVAPARRVDWVERLERLYTAVVSDILDSLGYRQQAMHGRIRPLWPEARCAGYALTVQTAPAREQQPAQPYAGELAAVDALQQHDVLVVSSCPWSVWGELLSTAALRRGCRGVILDGPTRDSRAIL
ncbi:MAG: RraA family protein, partial [Gemmataceae bacterium]|nr:RraA family protein [Gemmataceae bacterium]